MRRVSGAFGRFSRARALVAGALLAVLASSPTAARAHPAVATGATFLAWSACYGAPLALSSADFDCGAPAVYTLVGSFAVAEPIAHAVSMDVNLELSFPSLAEVPAFWNVQLGGCNSSALRLTKGISPGCGGHVNAFCRGDTNQCDMIYAATVTPGSNVLKVDITLKPPSVLGVPLAAWPQLYYAFTLGVPLGEATQCGGCSAPATVSWVSGTIYPVDDGGLPITQVTVASSYPGAAGCAALNGGSTGCTNTPTLRRTWGQLKSLYR